MALRWLAGDVLMGRHDAAQDAIEAAARIGAGVAASPEVAERRAHARAPYHREVFAVWESHSTTASRPTAMRATDISPAGIRFLTRLVLPRGTRGAALLIRADNTTVLVGLEVMHMGYAGAMLNACGCRFVAVPEALRSVRFGSSDDGGFTVEDRPLG